jgi:VanZ family protein
MRLPAPCYRSTIWFTSFAIWFVVLWVLSSGPLLVPPVPEIPHIDKVLHFGYYFGGAGLLSAALFLFRRSPRLGWDVIHLTVIVLVTTTGIIDEWHQSWYEFRSGNDAGDLAADFLGAVTGTLVFRRFRRVLSPD